MTFVATTFGVIYRVLHIVGLFAVALGLFTIAGAVQSSVGRYGPVVESFQQDFNVAKDKIEPLTNAGNGVAKAIGEWRLRFSTGDEQRGR